MKGISRLVIVGLVVLIMVALISLTYNFTLNVSPKTSLKSVSFVAADCDEIEDGERIFKFTIRNAGSETITASEIAVFLDGSMMQEVPEFSDIQAEKIDTEKMFVNKTELQGKSGEHVMMVSSPGGEIIKTVNCP